MNKPVFDIDQFVVFHEFIRVTGWIYLEKSNLSKVCLLNNDREMAVGQVGLDSPDVNSLGKNLRFKIYSLIPKEFMVENTRLVFQFMNREIFHIDYPIIKAKLDELKYNKPHILYLTELKENLKSILEIGSRARSGIVRRELFEGLDYVGIDIIGGENVDIVGDAHELSRLLNGRKFDAVYCISTFEHLIMPWKVVLEINKALTTGGLCLIHSHQTSGMHDLPCDYWRFSDTSWYGLFNKYTGFEIISTLLTEPNMLVPFIFVPEFSGYEAEAGFKGSTVLARKISETSLEWDVAASEIARGEYSY